jgi:GGDEF domain-containing protein
MVIVVVVACALVVGGALLLALRLVNVRSSRQTDDVLRSVDAHLEGISTSVAQAIARVVEATAARPAAFLTLDFDALVDELVAEAASRTGAEAAVLNLEGPGRRRVTASLGPGADSDLLERTFGSPDALRFRAATIEWAYAPLDEPGAHLFRSALVTPVGASAPVPGVLAVFSTSPGAFRTEQAAVLRTLVDDAEVALANARRFADVEARTLVDPTGVLDPRGYELELEREVARAQRTGRPLSVVFVELGGTGAAGHEREAPGLGEMARLVTRVTRGTDISCRRGDRQLAILLPETRETGATRLTARLHEEARRALGGGGQPTFTVGYAEWRPNESVASLVARAEAASARPLVAVGAAREENTLPGNGDRRGSDRGESASDELRSDALDALAHVLPDAREAGRSLALALLEVDGLARVGEQLGRDVADALLGDIAQFLDRGVANGSVHRLAQTVFALVLVDATIDDAETLVDALRASLELPEGAERVTLTAGVTEFVESDDAAAALGRTEHALWQAKQAGPGTVVVVVPGSRNPGVT